jgi:hypothetical protein
MDTDKSQYAGPERRTRRAYITQNHEYHCKGGVCVAVRNRGTSAFVPRHAAIGKKVSGAFVFKGQHGIVSMLLPDDVAPGQRVYFAIDVQDPSAVMTSALQSIERPPRALVAQYDRTLDRVRSVP